ncbi:MAG: hypothetical protein IJC46_04440 [Clostridia bacterium]|nr:hypothetical protein [Clostridia bacterium]
MRRMKWTALIAAVVMMLSMLAVGASAAVALTVAPVSAAEIGGEVKVNLSLPAGSGVMGATFEITYDNEALALKAAENGNLFSTFVGVDESTIGSDPFRISVVNTKNVTAAGNVAVLTFTVLDAAEAGNYEITVKTVKAANVAEEEISIADAVGTVTVEKSAVVLGDVNGDGNVTLLDAVRLLNYLNNPTKVVIAEQNADVNQNGSVGLTDAIALLIKLNR